MLLYIYMFIAGSIIGSFLNVVGLRVPIKKSIIKPGSTCPNCKEKIKKYDLIPVLSYFILRGKCRNCKNPMSPIYPTFEALTGLGFVGAFYYANSISEMIFFCLVISLMMALTVADIEYRLVPDTIILFTAIVIVPYGIYNYNYDFMNHIIAGVGGFLFFLIMAMASKGGMGGGDIKLIGVLGLALGFEKIIIIILVSSIIGVLYGLIVKMITKEKAPLPFVPFMAIGTVISMFYGAELWAILIA